MFRAVSGLLIFACFVYVASSLLAPPAYWLWDALFPGTAPFRRVFNRVLMIVGLLGVWPLAWYWGARSWALLGMEKRNLARELAVGLAWGLASAGVLFFAQMGMGLREWNPSFHIKYLGAAVLAAVLVSFFEELLFRGLLFRALWERLGKWVVVWAVLGSMVFATAHFIKALDLPGGVGWLSGWKTWAVAFPEWTAWPGLLAHWVSLVLVGLILCASVWRSKRLWLAMGIHAGWVFVLKLNERLTAATEKEPTFWMGGNPLEGLIPCVVLLIMLVWMLRGARHEAQRVG